MYHSKKFRYQILVQQILTTHNPFSLRKIKFYLEMKEKETRRAWRSQLEHYTSKSEPPFHTSCGYHFYGLSHEDDS